MYGIENLKKAVTLGLDLGMQFEKSLADGWQWTDSFAFVDELIQVPGVIKSGKDIVLELKDLDETEKNELVEYVKANFDIEDDKLEATVEKALAVALSIISLLDSLRKPAEQAPPVE